MSRLFVPMGREAFADFRDDSKVVEVRPYGGNFTEKTVREGREVELRLGYSGGQAIWGEIGRVVVGSLPAIFASFDLAEVEPRFPTVEAAVADNLALLGEVEKAIAFEVLKRRLEQR